MAKDKGKKANKTSSDDLISFGDFSLLPLHVEDSDTPHMLYVRRHVSKQVESGATEKSFLNGRTLFMVNLPADTTYTNIRALFKPAGRITDVHFQKMNPEQETEEASSGTKRKRDATAPIVIERQLLPSGSSAHVVFLEQEGLDKVFTHMKDVKWPPKVDNAKPLGLERYTSIYINAHPSPTDLQAHVDAFMQNFALEETKRKESQRVQKANLPDDDGFITVTRSNRSRGGIGSTGVKMQHAKQALEESKKKTPELQDFYRFQMRQKKRDDLAELRRKFNEDKERVAKWKEGRKFRPY